MQSAVNFIARWMVEIICNNPHIFIEPLQIGIMYQMYLPISLPYTYT